MLRMQECDLPQMGMPSMMKLQQHADLTLYNVQLRVHKACKEYSANLHERVQEDYHVQ